jgi:antitoxin ParD1/3/4
MVISLPPEMELLVQRQVESGRYGSIEEVLTAGLKSLFHEEDVDDIYQGRLEELRRDAQIGIDAAARGELIDLDTAMDTIRETMRQRYGASCDAT